jgi:hypothetical protein
LVAVFSLEARTMKNLQEATERICDLKGSLVAMDALMAALIRVLPAEQRAELRTAFEDNAEVARTVMLHASISELSIAAFERDVERTTTLIGS